MEKLMFAWAVTAPQADLFSPAFIASKLKDTKINWMEEQTDQSVNVWWERSNI